MGEPTHGGIDATDTLSQRLDRLGGLVTGRDRYEDEREQESRKRKREAFEDGDSAELERDRHVNDMKLKSRLEHLFSKYGRDFSDVADEVDIVTGEVIVNNGHLRHMRTDWDLGGGRAGRLAAMFGAQPDSEDERSEGGQDSADGASDGDELDASGDDAEAYLDLGSGTSDATSGDDYDTECEDDIVGAAEANDVWNDVPLLPGDVGYDPFATASETKDHPANALQDFQAGVSGQITQLMEALQKLAPPPQTHPQTSGGMMPQVTINLDPKSADYGKPVIVYVPSAAPKPAQPATESLEKAKPQARKKISTNTQNHSRVLAARVLQRIADAGLPTAPGADGKFPRYKGRKASADYGRSEEGDASPSPGSFERIATNIPIDPALEGHSSLADEVPRPPTSDSATLAKEQSTYTEEDDELILELKGNRSMTMEDIQKLFFKDRRISSLQYRYYTYLQHQCHKEFSEEDDRLIVRLREEEGLSWFKIRESHFPEFTVYQLRYHYSSRLGGVQKTRWTEEHDALITRLKDEEGWTWQAIRDQHFPKRTLGQVSYRYYKNCRPKDWKQNLIAAAEAFNEVDETSGSNDNGRPTKSKDRTSKTGSRIWTFRKRLAAANSQLADVKVGRLARLQQHRSEKSQLEAARLEAQEKRREKHEAQMLAELKRTLASQECNDSGPHGQPQDQQVSAPRNKGRKGGSTVAPDVPILSPASPEGRIESPTGQDGAVGELDAPDDESDPEVDDMPKFEDDDSMLDDLEEVSDDPDEGDGVLREAQKRALETEQQQRARRAEDRRIYEEALKMGPALRIKGAEASTDFSNAGTTLHRQDAYVSPYPCVLPDKRTYALKFAAVVGRTATVNPTQQHRLYYPSLHSHHDSSESGSGSPSLSRSQTPLQLPAEDQPPREM